MREWQPTPAFSPGEVHEQRSLAGYSPRGRKQSDMAEQLTLSLLIHLYVWLNPFAVPLKLSKHC